MNRHAVLALVAGASGPSVHPVSVLRPQAAPHSRSLQPLRARLLPSIHLRMILGLGTLRVASERKGRGTRFQSRSVIVLPQRTARARVSKSAAQGFSRPKSLCQALVKCAGLHRRPLASHKHLHSKGLQVSCNPAVSLLVKYDSRTSRERPSSRYHVKGCEAGQSSTATSPWPH